MDFSTALKGCSDANRISDSDETKSENGCVHLGTIVWNLTKQNCGENDNPTKPKVEWVAADDFDDVFIAVISQANVVDNVKNGR